MDKVPEPTSVRVDTLMTPAEKSRLEGKAREAQMSVSEFVRRAVEAYEPEEIQQLAALARAFRASAERASAAVDRANAAVGETLNQLRERRA